MNLPQAKIVIATPTRATIHEAQAQAIWDMLVQTFRRPDAPFILAGYMREPSSIVVSRSRMARMFLERSPEVATHLLHLDADHSFTLEAIAGMVASGHDFVACPYPRRTDPDWARVTRLAGELPPETCAEALAYRYVVRFLPGQTDLALDDVDCAEVHSIGIGCCLVSRRALARMADEYRGELYFDDLDERTQTRHATVALYETDRARSLDHGGDFVDLLDDSYAFCHRWRQIDGRVMMYLGKGSPVNHHGDLTLRGHVEAFGFRRSE
jgi:hypothetical protein